MMCKHYNTPQGCSYGDKCQFAHGPSELRSAGAVMPQPMALAAKQQQRNPLNYKIVKCKNWERDGTCKYGAHCTFAHGDNDVRSKSDNLYQMQPMQMAMPIIYDMNGNPITMPGIEGAPMQGFMPMMGVDQNMLMGMNMANQQIGIDMINQMQQNPPQNNQQGEGQTQEKKNSP